MCPGGIFPQHFSSFSPFFTLFWLLFCLSFFSSCSRSWCVLRPGICLSGSEQREFNPVEVVETNVKASRQSREPRIYHCMHLCVYQPIEAGFWPSVTLKVELGSCLCTSVQSASLINDPPFKGKVQRRPFLYSSSIFCGSGNLGQIPMGHKYGKYGPPILLFCIYPNIGRWELFFFIPDPLG